MRLPIWGVSLMVIMSGCAPEARSRNGDATPIVMDAGGADVAMPEAGRGDASPTDADLVVDAEASVSRDGSVDADAGGAGSTECVALADDLPCVHNRSRSTDAHALVLLRRAVEGLGFGLGASMRPRSEDRAFIGRYYIVWLDETGFYGKANGLWRLNGLEGGDLDFLVTDRGERPVNSFVVGEDGEGLWPAGYRGSEHLEFPNRTPETDDDPSCAAGDWCNQFGLAEAGSISLRAIPHWSSCNTGAPSWDVRREAIEVVEVPGGLRFVYEGRLVKVADGDGRWDGDACYEDWLFPDGVRRPVFLRTGYELYDSEHHIDRLFQLRNPVGNPAFEGPMGLIGGFVFTGWPEPHHLKRLNRFMRPSLRDVEDARRGRTLSVGRWNLYAPEPIAGDEVFGWMNQPVALSAFPEAVPGRSAELSHVGPRDNEDVGLCLCSVHGGLEMGGGVLHAGVSTPILGGALTIESRRRLDWVGDSSALVTHVYEAGADLSHAIGRREGDGWSANVADDMAGHLSFGPYATDWGGRAAQVVFDIMIDITDARAEAIVTLDVYDATADQVLVSQDIPRYAFERDMRYQSFALDVDLMGRAGHRMEARVYWHRRAYTRVDRVRAFVVR